MRVNAKGGVCGERMMGGAAAYTNAMSSSVKDRKW